MWTSHQKPHYVKDHMTYEEELRMESYNADNEV